MAPALAAPTAQALTRSNEVVITGKVL